MPTDPIDTAALRKLLAEATPGPWERTFETYADDDWDAITAPPVTGADIVAEAPERGLDSYDLRWPPNCALIVAMRNSLPALLDELDLLREVAAAFEAYWIGQPGALDRLDAALARLRAPCPLGCGTRRCKRDEGCGETPCVCSRCEECGRNRI